MAPGQQRPAGRSFRFGWRPKDECFQTLDPPPARSRSPAGRRCSFEAARRRVEAGAVDHPDLPGLPAPATPAEPALRRAVASAERRARPAQQFAPGMLAVLPGIRNPRLDRRHVESEGDGPLRMARVYPRHQVPPRRLQVGLRLPAKDIGRRLDEHSPGVGRQSST